MNLMQMDFSPEIPNLGKLFQWPHLFICVVKLIYSWLSVFGIHSFSTEVSSHFQSSLSVLFHASSTHVTQIFLLCVLQNPTSTGHSVSNLPKTKIAVQKILAQLNIISYSLIFSSPNVSEENYTFFFLFFKFILFIALWPMCSVTMAC